MRSPFFLYANTACSRLFTVQMEYQELLQHLQYGVARLGSLKFYVDLICHNVKAWSKVPKPFPYVQLDNKHIPEFFLLIS